MIHTLIDPVISVEQGSVALRPIAALTLENDEDSVSKSKRFWKWKGNVGHKNIANLNNLSFRNAF